MKTTKYLFYTFFLFSFYLLTSCEDDKNDTNTLIGTEWADNNGIWLFSFKSNSKVEVLYSIQMAVPHTLSYQIPYEKDGDKLFIKDFMTSSPHTGDFYLIKDFSGKISGNTINCNFFTPSTKLEEGQTMPDLSKLTPVHVLLRKK